MQQKLIAFGIVWLEKEELAEAGKSLKLRAETKHFV
jgi:hypothetical protein